MPQLVSHPLPSESWGGSPKSEDQVHVTYMIPWPLLFPAAERQMRLCKSFQGNLPVLTVRTTSTHTVERLL